MSHLQSRMDYASSLFRTAEYEESKIIFNRLLKIYTKRAHTENMCFCLSRLACIAYTQGEMKKFNENERIDDKIEGRNPVLEALKADTEIDKIYVQLKQYETEIKQSNRKLNQMFEANVNYYHELVKYILAGEQGCQELEAYIAQRQMDMEVTGDASIQFELTTLQQSLMMLEQRTQDLRTAESIAMQSIPMIKTMEFSNMNLVRKINSAFIITLPVFKQALAQAILLKRQRVQAEAISALDEKTNELLIKNAKNTAEQSKMIARMTEGSSIKIETLETTWKTIVSGIEETKQIQENARKKRNEDKVKFSIH